MTLVILSTNYSLSTNFCSTLCNISHNVGMRPKTIRAFVKNKKRQKWHNPKTRLKDMHKRNCLAWICNLINKNGFLTTFISTSKSMRSGFYWLNTSICTILQQIKKYNCIAHSSSITLQRQCF